MEVALKKKENDGKKVVPIIISQCDWKKTSIVSLQVLPRDKKPLNSAPDKDEALNEIVNEIYRVVDRIRVSHHNEEISTPIDGIEFVNRDSILKEIMSTYPAPYLLISAPPGYGKTRLLTAAKFRLEKEQDWYCINLILSRNCEYSIKQFTLKLLKAFKISDEEITILEIDLTAEKYGKYLGITIVNLLKKLKQKKTNIKDKFCILIDQAEVLDYPHQKDISLIQEIFGKFLPAMSDVMKEKNQNIRWRFIFSGRYISEWENKIKKKLIPLKTYELELFKPKTIFDAIRKYADDEGITLDPKVEQKLAAFTFNMTGGHPRYMVKIIKDSLDSSIEDVIKNENKYYSEILIPIIEDIKKQNPSEYTIFKTLCIVRKIKRTLLDEFIKAKLIKGYQSKFYIEEKLLNTFFFHRNEYFLEDAIIRRILAIHLRRSNGIWFKEMCQKAVDCYLRELADPKGLEPAMLAVELLFLQLHAYCVGNYSKPDAKRYFTEKINHIIETIERNRDENTLEIIECIRDLLKNDQEFKLNLQYLVNVDMRQFLNVINSKIEQLKPSIEEHYVTTS
jgi:DNA polymerase III delta prime subunit